MRISESAFKKVLKKAQQYLIDGGLTRGNVSPPTIKVFTPIFPDENVAPVSKLAGTISKIVASLKFRRFFEFYGLKGPKIYKILKYWF